MATAKTSSTRKTTSSSKSNTESTTTATPASTNDTVVNELKARISQLESQIENLESKVATATALASSVNNTSTTDKNVVDKALLRRTLERMGIRQHVISGLGI